MSVSSIGSGFASGVYGWRNSFAHAGRAAADIAGATVSERSAGPSGKEGDLVSGVTGLSMAEIEAKASAKVLQADSDMIGTLVDITV